MHSLDLRERAEEIADFAVGERHNKEGMYQHVADMALTELRAAVEAERARGDELEKIILELINFGLWPRGHSSADELEERARTAIRRSTDNE